MRYTPVLTIGFSLYWMLFWALNGMDKFLCGKKVLGFTWYGKDRTNQFGGYFERLEITDPPIGEVLVFAGVVELLVAVPFALVLVVALRARQGLSEQVSRWMQMGLFASTAVFIGFVVFDVIVGDRAELLEHSTYLIAVAATYLLAHAEPLIMQRKSAPAAE